MEIKKLYRYILSIIIGIGLILMLNAPTMAGMPNRVGINIGDHFSEIDAAASIVGQGGWIVVMAQPGDCKTLIPEFFKNHPEINFIIRGHYPDTELTPGLAKTWANTLANMDTNGKKIYFYPINEPRTEGIPDSTVIEYVRVLRNELQSIGALHNKVILLSPAINVTHGGGAGNQAYFNRLGGSAFFSQFDGIALNIYDYQTQCSPATPFCASPPTTPNTVVSQMGLSPSTPIYLTESGVVNNGQNYVMYYDNQLSAYFDAGHSKWGDQVKMAAVFSYDPVPIAQSPSWSIYGTQTAGLFSGKLQSIYDHPLPPNIENFSLSHYQNVILPIQKLETKQYKLGEDAPCCVTFVEPDGTTYCRVTPKKIDACSGPLFGEEVTYRGEVVGPWILKGKDLDFSKLPTATSNPGTSGTVNFTTQFVIQPGGHYQHDRFLAFTLTEIGNINRSADSFVDTIVQQYPYRAPPITRFAIPSGDNGVINQEPRYNIARQAITPKSYETWSDAIRRRFSNNQTEIGTKATTIATTFLGCLQKKEDKDAVGMLFPLRGQIELITPPDIETLEIASIDETKSLAVPPCTNGFCHPVHRFEHPEQYNDFSNALLDNSNRTHLSTTNNTSSSRKPELVQFNDHLSEQLATKSQNIKENSTKTLDIFNPQVSNAANVGDIETTTCDIPPAQIGLFTIPDEISPNGHFKVSYVIKGICTGFCTLGDVSFVVNGVEIILPWAGGDTCTKNFTLMPGYGGAPGLPDLQPGGTVTLNVHMRGSPRGTPPPTCGNVCPQSYDFACTISSVKNPNGPGYVAESSCKIPPPPPPNCTKCETWAPPYLCSQIQAKNLTTEPRCPKGECKTDTSQIAESCIWKLIHSKIIGDENEIQKGNENLITNADIQNLNQMVYAYVNNNSNGAVLGDVDGQDNTSDNEDANGNSDVNNPNDEDSFIEQLFKCLPHKTEYVFYVAPTGGFIADLNQHRTQDMSISDALYKIPNVNDNVFAPEPSKAKIYLKLDTSKLQDFQLAKGSPVEFPMNVEYTDHVTQVRKYCNRLYALYYPQSHGFTITDPKITELCNPVMK